MACSADQGASPLLHERRLSSIDRTSLAGIAMPRQRLLLAGCTQWGMRRIAVIDDFRYRRTSAYWRRFLLTQTATTCPSSPLQTRRLERWSTQKPADRATPVPRPLLPLASCVEYVDNAFANRRSWDMVADSDVATPCVGWDEFQIINK